jgi:transposase
MSTSGTSKSNRAGRPNYPKEFKWRLAVAATQEGASVSQLAREHGINANMLFKWRRDLRSGTLSNPNGEVQFLQVTAATPERSKIVESGSSRPDASALDEHHGIGSIELIWSEVTLRLHGRADVNQLREILGWLGRPA